MRGPLLLVIVTIALAACPKAGGEYARRNPGGESDLDRGETQGRMFDFVSNKAFGDDWQIRVRGTSLYAAYSNEDNSDPLGSRNISQKDADKLWKLIDKVDLPERKKGKKNDAEGYVYLRLREPGEDGYDYYEAYVSRETEDEDVIELAEYIRELVAKYHKEEPNF